MPNLETKNSIVSLEADGFWEYRITARQIGNVDKIIAEAMAAKPVVVPSAFQLPDGSVAGIVVSPGWCLCWTEIETLNMDSNWVIENGLTRPTFKKTITPNSTEFSAVMQWSPKFAEMTLRFVSKFTYDRGKPQHCESYLLASPDKKKEFRRPPLPNVFDHCGMCMGNNYTNRGQTLSEAFAHCVGHLQTSSWNSDLNDGLEVGWLAAMFSFKEKEQQPPPKNFSWTTIPRCSVVSNDNYNHIPL